MQSMGKLLAIAGLAATMLLGGEASADGGSVFTAVPAVKAAPSVPAARSPWTGCQLGGFLGYGVETQRSVDDKGLVTFDVSTAADAALGGLSGVCGVTLAEKWVASAFADIAWTNASAQFKVPTGGDGVVGDIGIDHIITAGGRFGYLLTPKVQLYGLAGYSWASTQTVVASYESGKLGDKEGWTVGAGIQAMVSDRWSLQLEYRYTDFGSDLLKWGPNPASAADTEANLHQARIGLYHHF